jgi:hypothetical protein
VSCDGVIDGTPTRCCTTQLVLHWRPIVAAEAPTASPMEPDSAAGSQGATTAMPQQRSITDNRP